MRRRQRATRSRDARKAKTGGGVGSVDGDQCWIKTPWGACVGGRASRRNATMTRMPGLSRRTRARGDRQRGARGRRQRAHVKRDRQTDERRPNGGIVGERGHAPRPLRAEAHRDARRPARRVRRLLCIRSPRRSERRVVTSLRRRRCCRTGDDSLPLRLV